MSRGLRKFFAAALLILLLGVPFIDWKLGAVLWMCVWLIFILQNLFSKHNWKIRDNGKQEDKHD